MKTLTLSEAFDQATKGPLIADQNYIETYQVTVARCDVGQKPNCINAALLAHCFNHMQEVAAELEAALGVIEDLPYPSNYPADRIRLLLSKLNQVQIPA